MGKLGTAIVAAFVICLATGTAAQAEQQLTLNLQDEGSKGAAGPVLTAPLAAGAHYYAIVTGTGSIWAASQWSAPGIACGASEELPTFESPGVINGPVGWDAETVFAVPPGVNFYGFSCVPSKIPFQSTTHSPGGFQISVSGVGGFAHATPLGGERSTPTSGHSYTYSLIGTGLSAGFRFVDEPVADDYGEFMIKVLTSAECSAIDCEGSAAASNDQIVSASTTGSSGVKGTSLIKLPRACRSRRSFPIHFRIPRGVTVATIQELINGHLVHSFGTTTSAHVVKAGVNLRNFPAGTFRLELRVTTTRGQVLRSIRTYHTCRKKMTPAKKHR